MAQQQSNAAFMNFLQNLFGVRQGGGFGSNARQGNEYRSVQATAGANALPLSEQMKEKKKKDDAENRKKKKAIRGTELQAKGTIQPALNNKSLSSSVAGTIPQTGLNFSGSVTNKLKKKDSNGATSTGLNIPKKASY